MPPEVPLGRPPEGQPAEAPAFTRSTTLELLQELVDAADQLPRQVARRASMSPNELHTLRHLSAGSLSPGQIARLLSVSTAASSGVVDRLCERGHAERRTDPVDGRRTEVVITATGRAEMMARLAPMFAGLAELDAGLDETSRPVVERYLRGAIAAIRRLT